MYGATERGRILLHITNIQKNGLRFSINLLYTLPPPQPQLQPSLALMILRRRPPRLLPPPLRDRDLVANQALPARGILLPAGRLHLVEQQALAPGRRLRARLPQLRERRGPVAGGVGNVGAGAGARRLDAAADEDGEGGQAADDYCCGRIGQQGGLRGSSFVFGGVLGGGGEGGERGEGETAWDSRIRTNYALNSRP